MQETPQIWQATVSTHGLRDACPSHDPVPTPCGTPNLTLDMPSPSSLAYLETVFASYRAHVEESRRLAELRDALLPKLMSGEIDASEIGVL